MSFLSIVLIGTISFLGCAIISGVVAVSQMIDETELETDEDGE